jgi:hypothetical protein
VLRVQAAVDGPAVVTFWHTAFIAKTLEMRVQVRRVGVGGGWGQGGARGGCVCGGGGLGWSVNEAVGRGLALLTLLLTTTPPPIPHLTIPNPTLAPIPG